LKEFPAEAQRKERKPMDFSNALFMLKKGQKLTREGWNGVYLDVQQRTDEHVLPCICIGPAFPVKRMDWVPRQADIFAEDWMVVD
jgi:uncharacterized protein DUF2829